MKYQNKKAKPHANGFGITLPEQHDYAPQGFELPNEMPDLVLYIYDDIGPEVDYVDFVQALRYAPEGQNITIHINSQGGNLCSCMSIINAIRASGADITTVVDGEAASAAAMIWLAGHNKLIASRHTIVMLHGASVGYDRSKTVDIVTGTMATSKLVEGLLDDLTDGFLTDEERNDIRKGMDVYLTGTEILKRFGPQVEGEIEESQD